MAIPNIGMTFDTKSVLQPERRSRTAESQSVKSDVKELSFEQLLQARGVSRPYVRARVRVRTRNKKIDDIATALATRRLPADQ